jgi:Spy/CpxP family protein refolding chaperone
MKRTIVASLALVAGLFTGACAHTDAGAGNAAAPAAAAETGPSEAQAEAGVREHHRHHHGSVAAFIALSLDTLGTDEAKRPQIEKVQSDLRACMAPAREIEKGFLSTVADGVAAGTVDTAKLDAAVEQIGTASDSVHGCAASALNQLHAILSPGERQALVTKVQAHYELWRQENHDAVPGAREKGSRLAAFAEELNLTPDQVSQISTALHDKLAGSRLGPFDPAKAEAHLKAFETAFAADTFDATKITENANGHIARHGLRRMALFYETVTPLLTPEQRTLLADHLRQRAEARSAHPQS